MSWARLVNAAFLADAKLRRKWGDADAMPAPVDLLQVGFDEGTLLVWRGGVIEIGPRSGQPSDNGAREGSTDVTRNPTVEALDRRHKQIIEPPSRQLRVIDVNVDVARLDRQSACR